VYASGVIEKEEATGQGGVNAWECFRHDERKKPLGEKNGLESVGAPSRMSKGPPSTKRQPTWSETRGKISQGSKKAKGEVEKMKRIADLPQESRERFSPRGN